MLYYLTEKEINRLLIKINLFRDTKTQKVIEAFVYRKNFNRKMQDTLSNNRTSNDEKRYPFF